MHLQGTLCASCWPRPAHRTPSGSLETNERPSRASSGQRVSKGWEGFHPPQRSAVTFREAVFSLSLVHTELGRGKT